MERIEEGLLFIEDGEVDFLFDTEGLQFMEGISVNEYYDVDNISDEYNCKAYYIGTQIYKITGLDDKELPVRDSSVVISFIVESEGKNVVKANKKITVAKNYNFDTFDLELPFLFNLKNRRVLSISQSNKEVKEYDENQIVDKGYVFLKTLGEKVKNNENDHLDEDELTLIEMGKNYQGNPRRLDKNHYLKNRRLPIDTNKLVHKSSHKIENVSLHYFKFPKINDNKFKFENGVTLQSSTLAFTKILIDRQVEVVEKITANKRCWEQTTASRLLIGGESSVHENSILLHHVYGIPYVSASSLKGAMRNYLLQCFFSLTEEEKESLPVDGEDKKENIKKRSRIVEKRAMHDPIFAAIFGNDDDREEEQVGSVKQEASIGGIMFFDSFTENPKIEVDIMTPHYKKWYGADEKKLDQTPPADIYTPDIIKFLTIPADISFQFVLGVCKSSEKWMLEGESELLPSHLNGTCLLEIAEYWLQQTLMHYGIGRKTAVGYGFFGEPKQ